MESATFPTTGKTGVGFVISNNFYPRQRHGIVDFLRKIRLVRTHEIKGPIAIHVEQMSVMETQAQQLDTAGGFDECSTRGILLERLGGTAVLRHDKIQQIVPIVVEPDGQPTADVIETNPELGCPVNECAIFIHQKLTGIAGSGTNQKILITVVIEIRPGPAMRIRARND